MMEKMGWGREGEEERRRSDRRSGGRESARPVPRGGDRRRAHPQHSALSQEMCRPMRFSLGIAIPHRD